MSNPGELKAALLEIVESIDRLPIVEVGDGMNQLSATYCSLTTGSHNTVAIVAQQAFRRGAALAAELVPLSEILRESIGSTIRSL